METQSLENYFVQGIALISIDDELNETLSNLISKLLLSIWFPQQILEIRLFQIFHLFAKI
jgi:hypothetical protein